MAKPFGQTFGGGLLSSSAKPLLDLGLGLINTSQQKKLQDRSYKQSIELERIRQENELQLQREQQKALEIQKQIAQLTASKGRDVKASKNKWILPVAIGGGLLILGTVIFFAIKKK